MKLAIYQIDAFAEKQFEGNPAAVVPLEKWLPDSVMQAIAEENNLAETAFFVSSDSSYHIRWFTPNKEVKLCGHATLASAYVLFNILACKEDVLTFESLSGKLLVSKTDNFLTLDFPAQPPTVCNTPASLVTGLGLTPSECLKHDDYIAVFENEEDVLSITPDHESLKQLDLRGVIATAPSSKFDFIARFFAPKFGIPEDSVTGSAYTQLMPYWSEKFNKSKLHAKQVSERGGKLICEIKGTRVLISGSAVTYMEGSIEIKT
ncbi:PhzF family phenazine biosynthesis protein [Porticoccus sp.]|uniref:PhzF family phenazine biosynthesis protein n=1 Tax=Porticoccus sp. TaxID=2024853 RepID=UPI000C37BE6D|nr:PhzF family phenazine biosynthesis protein [Porticoccus sp.]MAZ71302.1 isomerase [Porticoccus sp.]|tara:strand:+ start:216 stop:1001 length:786 start_codon:yes stop_codon:yes gene_type:complete